QAYGTLVPRLVFLSLSVASDNTDDIYSSPILQPRARPGWHNSSGKNMRTDDSMLTANSDSRDLVSDGTHSVQPAVASAAPARQSRHGSSIYASACVSLSVLMAVRTALADPTGGQVT